MMTLSGMISLLTRMVSREFSRRCLHEGGSGVCVRNGRRSRQCRMRCSTPTNAQCLPDSSGALNAYQRGNLPDGIAVQSQPLSHTRSVQRTRSTLGRHGILRYRARYDNAGEITQARPPSVSSAWHGRSVRSPGTSPDASRKQKSSSLLLLREA